METQGSRAVPPRLRGWVRAGAVVGALALVIGVAAWPRSTGPAVAVATPAAGASGAPVAVASPTVRPPEPPSNGPQLGSCVEAYSLETLAGRGIAFDGTVTAINGEEVRFEVTRAYRGVTGGSVALRADGMTGSSIGSVDGPAFQVGGRYLVAGEDRFAWGCGFSQPYDPAVAEDWARTFAP